MDSLSSHETGSRESLCLFRNRSKRHRPFIKQRKNILDRAREKSDEKKPRFQERGQLTPRQRLDALVDPDSEFLDLYSMANYLVQDPDPETSIAGANMIAGIGFVNGTRCMILVDDSGISAGAATDKTIGKALGCIDIAMKQKLQT